MKCQVCKKTITPAKAHDHDVLQCEGCHGFWIKQGELNDLINHNKGDLEFSSIDHHLHKDTHGIMKCIFCPDYAMIKVNFLEYSDIVLDYCEDCGAFWIDHGELTKMQKYIDSFPKKSPKNIIQIIMESITYWPKL